MHTTPRVCVIHSFICWFIHCGSWKHVSYAAIASGRNNLAYYIHPPANGAIFYSHESPVTILPGCKLQFHPWSWMKVNGIYVKVKDAKKFMGLEVEVPEDGVKKASSLEWWSAVVSIRQEANINLMVRLKERLEDSLVRHSESGKETCV